MCNGEEMQAFAEGGPTFTSLCSLMEGCAMEGCARGFKSWTEFPVQASLS